MQQRGILKAAAGLAAVLLAAAWAPAAAEVDLIPQRRNLRGHDSYYQIPDNPVGLVFLAHGCAHSASDFWPTSEACPECRGLPMEVAHTKQALARGYAVLAVNSADRDIKCFVWWNDNIDVAAILNEFRARHGLAGKPLYAVGVSSGGAFVLKLPRLTQIDGIVSEAIGVNPLDWGAANVQPYFPPTVYLRMPKDVKTATRIDQDVAALTMLGRPSAVITILERPIYPSYFSDFSARISPDMSAKIYNGLVAIGMVNENGLVNQDPRYTKKPWQAQLRTAVPELSSDDVASDDSDIYELMNVAFAWHEIDAEYFTASLAWLELQGAVSMEALVKQFKITGRMSELTADRYPVGGQPPQAGIPTVSAASIKARNLIFSTADGQPLVPSSEVKASAVVASAGNGTLTAELNAADQASLGTSVPEVDAVDAAAAGAAAKKGSAPAPGSSAAAPSSVPRKVAAGAPSQAAAAPASGPNAAPVVAATSAGSTRSSSVARSAALAALAACLLFAL